MAQVGSTRASSSSTDETASILNNVESVKSATDNNTDTDTPFAFDALRQIASGSVSTGTINVDGANVDYNFSSTVDFANRKISISFTDIQNDGAGFKGTAGFFDGSGNPTPFDYSGTTGKVEFASGDFTYDSNCGSGGLGCKATATFEDAYNVDFNVSTTNHPSGTDGSATLN